MIKCCNCGKYFTDEENLSKIVERCEINGNGHTDGALHTVSTTIYDPENPLENTETVIEEVFNGCSECMTDEYLSDIPEEDTTLFMAVVAEGINYSSHASDLYIPITARTKELIKEYKCSDKATTFKNNIDGERWYDLPFEYTPFWEEVNRKSEKAKKAKEEKEEKEKEDVTLVAVNSVSLTSGSVIVTDPCYDEGIWCSSKIENVLPGEYTVFYFDGKKENYFTDNRCFCVIHSENEDELEWVEVESEHLGMDAGMASIVDACVYKEFKQRDSFWGEVCSASDDDEIFVIDNAGVFCSSGYGDGRYLLSIAKNTHNQIVGLKIDF